MRWHRNAKFNLSSNHKVFNFQIFFHLQQLTFFAHFWSSSYANHMINNKCFYVLHAVQTVKQFDVNTRGTEILYRILKISEIKLKQSSHNMCNKIHAS